MPAEPFLKGKVWWVENPYDPGRTMSLRTGDAKRARDKYAYMLEQRARWIDAKKRSMDLWMDRHNQEKGG